MKDELHVFCRLEGISEEYLRARTKDDKKLLLLEKRRNKDKERPGPERSSLKCSAEPYDGNLLD